MRTIRYFPHLALIFFGVAALLGSAPTAHAQDKGAGGVGEAQDLDQPNGPESASPTPSIEGPLGRYGDPGGYRAFLQKRGITYNFTYIGEVLGNTSGGIKRGATYEGRLDGQLDVDLDKLAGVKDLSLHANFYQIHGRGLSGNNLMDLFTVSNIEAYPDTKLYEAWGEQKFADGKLALRAGQLAADTEFFISQTAGLFINSTFNWPANLANDLPSGGPAYPLATPGVRLKITPNDKVTGLIAVFNGDPAGAYVPGVNNILPQLRDFGGTDFRVEDPPLLMAEAQYAYNQEKGAKGLPGTVKLGYLHHFEDFPAFNVPPNVTVNYHGNDGAYLVLDQAIYRVPGTDDQGAAMFLRVSGLPGDRNLIDIYADGGLTYKGPTKSRPDDTLGIAAAYGRISPSVARQDRLSGAYPLIRDYQLAIEATYQAVIVPGFTLQPEVQYIFHPGAHGVADPSDGLPIRDAAVFGLRTTIHY